MTDFMSYNLLLVLIIISNLGFYIWTDESLVLSAVVVDVVIFLYSIQFFKITLLPFLCLRVNFKPFLILAINNFRINVSFINYFIKQLIWSFYLFNKNHNVKDTQRNFVKSYFLDFVKQTYFIQLWVPLLIKTEGRLTRFLAWKTSFYRKSYNWYFIQEKLPGRYAIRAYIKFNREFSPEGRNRRWNANSVPDAYVKRQRDWLKFLRKYARSKRVYSSGVGFNWRKSR